MRLFTKISKFPLVYYIIHIILWFISTTDFVGLVDIEIRFTKRGLGYINGRV